MLVHKQNEKGIGLIEVIAALGISIVVLTSLVSLSLFTLRSSLQSKLLLQGTKLANRELELVRALRDSCDNWHNVSGTGFLDQVQNCDGVSARCHMQDAGLSISEEEGIIDEGTAEEITHYFTATDPSDGGALEDTDTVARITVVVSWQIGDEQKSTRLYTDLTNWQN